MGKTPDEMDRTPSPAYVRSSGASPETYRAADVIVKAIGCTGKSSLQSIGDAGGRCHNCPMVTRRARPAIEQLPTAALRLPALPAGINGVEVRRSSRRRRTVSARVAADQIVVLLPTGLSTAEEQQWVNKMITRLARERSRPAKSDDELAQRARLVASKYLEPAVGMRLQPSSVRWVTNMAKRWASCSTDSGAIRVSHRLQQMPDYVLEYVLAHELLHLVEPGHSRRFHELLARYPLAERAEGFLQGWTAARQPAADGSSGTDDLLD